MNTTEFNVELFSTLSKIAGNEDLMSRLLKYAKKLATKKEDPTLMTKEEFFAKIERGERDFREGRCHEILPGEDLTTYLKRRGYDL